MLDFIINLIFNKLFNLFLWLRYFKMDSVITTSSDSECAIVISSDSEYPVDTLDFIEDTTESDDDISKNFLICEIFER